MKLSKLVSCIFGEVIIKGVGGYIVEDIEKKVILKCSVCGNDQFFVDDQIAELLHAPDDTEIKCSDCGRIVTKEQLIEENSYIINENLEDVKNDVKKQVKKELKDMFRKFK